MTHQQVDGVFGIFLDEPRWPQQHDRDDRIGRRAILVVEHQALIR